MKNKMKGLLANKRTKIAAFLGLFVVLIGALILSPIRLDNIVTYLKNINAAGEVPAHSKTRDKNGDGTYKLELTVTGDADNETDTASNVNVIIVYDVSSSMTSNIQGGSYTRADQAENVVHSFVHDLFGYQSKQHPENIQVALVTFARTGTVRQSWTSEENDINKYFDEGGTDRTTNLSSYSGCYSGTASNGTNWQSALEAANDLLNGTNGQQAADKDPTFVILVTDGAPTASGNGQNAINPSGASLSQLRPFYEAARTNARSIQSKTDTTLYGIYAYGTEADLLDDLMYYANTGSERTIRTQTDPTDNYYNTANTTALEQAINSIFEKIVQAMGISNVSINDGTTTGVTTTSGKVSHLLVVDESSYEYWLEVPIVGNQFKRTNLVSGEEITYTVRENGTGRLQITWTENGENKQVNVNGKLSNSSFKYKWEEANDLYDKAPPAAHLENDNVKWTLGTAIGTLLDGVTYSVTFDVYPSQETYDMVAEVKNASNQQQAYEALDENIREYLKFEDGAFSLETNTEATLTYTDTRNNNGPQTVSYTNPPRIAAESSELNIEKVWLNELDKKQAPDSLVLEMNLIKDEEDTGLKITVDKAHDCRSA